MTNPVNPIRAALPNINTPLVDPSSGVISSEWYHWCLSILNRTGGAEGTSTTDVQIVAASALALARLAQSDARAAETQAATATSAAIAATSGATAAQAAADTAAATASVALTRGANLSDLTSNLTARRQLGVDTYPITFQIATLAAGALYVPVVHAISIPVANAVYAYAETAPSADATFWLKKIAAVSGAVTVIGSFVLSGNSIIVPSIPAQTSLAIGDVLQLIVPATDAANVGITVRALLAN